jgi:hypothetical protein
MAAQVPVSRWDETRHRGVLRAVRARAIAERSLRSAGAQEDLPDTITPEPDSPKVIRMASSGVL